MATWNDLLGIINKRIKDLESDKRAFKSHASEHEYNDLSIHRRRLRRITRLGTLGSLATLHSRLRNHERPETHLHNLVMSETFHDLSTTIHKHVRGRLDANEYYRTFTRLTGAIEHEKTIMEIEYATVHDPSQNIFISALKELKVHIITKAPISRFANIIRLRRLPDFNTILLLVHDFHTIRPT